jgi:glutamate 5-kinase
MSKAAEIINRSRKIVLKIGSNVLADSDGCMDESVVQNITEQVARLRSIGKQVVIVSSGAEVSGVSAVGIWSRHGDLNYKQAMCAVGQVELMMAYKKYFLQQDVIVGQLLLTRANFGDAGTALHIRNTLFTLLDEDVVPIINENDSVSVDEFEIGDNDRLAALTSNLWNSDLLILMSDINGLYDKSPKEYDDAKLIREVRDISSLRDEIVTGGTSSYGTGGMDSKINAAAIVGEYGTPLLLVCGKTPDVLVDMADGADAGTIFIPEKYK